MAVARMRMSRIALVPVLFLTICVLPVTVGTPWAWLLMAVPLALAAWVFRVGVDLGDDGVTVRSLVARRTIAWDEVAGIRVGERADLWLVTTAGTQLQLPVLRARDLPRLAALSGGRIPAP
ncbi:MULTISPECIES: PH domain-containing protein [unclassified Modestobacter]|uniref:PH domain-containing protein n=1 Tax=unclassified Modestobacter TaxID=2643866 RepID=UPI0022AA6909|nr:MULTISPECIES: PH domain-containing protein [unclassified Modestobacter]MCZ2812574.1 PH domain-containing protein [Modestobacter sp. VKM Ac-2979]MCZ2841464.1 PH domain-containing protein [Modestobacter sp. VKM Ac-2980]MCZ2850819.1 PH domain-containing protein [Modestobacter sp. VKM Ac-2978]